MVGVTSSKPQPNRYGWTIVAFCFMGLAFTFTSRTTLGVMMPVWMAEFGWSKSFLAGGGSIALLAMAVTAPVSGNLIDRFGPRLVFTAGLIAIATAMLLIPVVQEPWQFIVVYSLIGGLGFGILGLPQAAATVSRYFTEKRGLAIGIAQSGGNGGQLALIPLFAILIGVIGWRTSYVILGLAALAFVPLALTLLRGTVAPASLGMTDSLRSRLRLLAHNSTFWLMFAGFVICGFTTAGVIEVHLLPYAALCGFDPVGSATAYGVLCAFNIVGTIGAGFLADKLHRPTLLAACYLLRAATFVLLMYVGSDLSLLFVFAVLFGTTNYATMPLIASITATHIGVRVIGLTLGLMLGGHWIGAALGSFVGGALFDQTARYQELWLVAIAAALVATALSLCVRERPPTTAATAAAPA